MFISGNNYFTHARATAKKLIVVKLFVNRKTAVTPQIEYTFLNIKKINLKMINYWWKLKFNTFAKTKSWDKKSGISGIYFHSVTDIVFQFKFRLWLSDLLNRAIDSDIKVLNHVLLTLASVGQIVGNYWPVNFSTLAWKNSKTM